MTWLHQELERYLRSLIERKFLDLYSPFYHNKLILAALPGLLSYYAAVYAAVRESEHIERQDYF